MRVLLFSDVFRGASIFALLTVFIGLVPLLMAVAYAIRPTAEKLALMRPLSLAALFGSLSGLVSGFIAILRGIGATGELRPEAYPRIAVGFSEALVPVFVGLGCLTIAWLLVALGMRRAVARLP